MKNVTVTLSQEILDAFYAGKCTYFSICDCPIARAYKDAGFNVLSVGGSFIDAFYGSYRHFWYFDDHVNALSASLGISEQGLQPMSWIAVVEDEVK